MPNPIDNEDLYDSILLAGVRSPGKVTLSGHDREETWDVKEAKGSAGATTTLNGDKVCQFTASFYLVKDVAQGIDDFAAWDAFVPIIRAMTTTKPLKGTDIYHPDLADNDIKSVSRAKIGGKVHDGKGGATVVVGFIEYRPPKPKSGSPSGSKSAENKSDPNADIKKQADDLLKQAQAP